MEESKPEIPPREKEDAIERPNSVEEERSLVLARQVARIRRSMQNRLQAMHRLALEQKSIDEQVPGEVSSDHIRSLTEALDTKEEVAPLEYLKRSHRALQGIQKLIEKVRSEKHALESNLRHSEWDPRARFKKERESLEGQGWLARLSTAGERKRMKLEYEAFIQDVKAAEDQIAAKDRFENKLKGIASDLRVRAEPFREKRNAAMRAAIGEQAQHLSREYADLHEQVSRDFFLANAGRRTYIEQVIVPKIEEIAAKNGISEEEKQKFFLDLESALERYDKAKPDDWAKNQAMFSALLPYESSFGDARYQCELLFEARTDARKDQEAVNQLVANMAGAEIRALRQALAPLKDKHQFEDPFVRMLYTGLDDNPIGRQIAGAANDEVSLDRIPMTQWDMLRQTPLAQEIFGEAIRDLDRRYYEAALDQSLSDTQGGAISKLSYYPTPETVKTLVLLAAADGEGYRVSHANSGLATLARRKDWPQILFAAMEQYPALGSLNMLLREWNYHEQSNHPNIQGVVEPFAQAILASKPKDQRVVQIARECLPYDSVLDALVEQGALTAGDVAILREVENVSSRYESFMGAVRDRMLAFAASKSHYQERLSQGELPFMQVLPRFLAVARRLIANKNNPAALGYLDSHNVVDRVEKQALSEDALVAFLDSYIACPALGEGANYELREKFCQHFKGEETARFYGDAIAAYADILSISDRYKLFAVLDLVAEGKLSKKRALELPRAAKEVFDHPQFKLAQTYPALFLETSEGVRFFKELAEKYNDPESRALGAIARAVAEQGLDRRLALIFGEQLPVLMDDEKMGGSRALVLHNAGVILKDVSDLQFINQLIGEYGNKSHNLIAGYIECVKVGAITTKEKELALEFARQFRVLSPGTMRGYKEAKATGVEKVYVAQLKALAENMTGAQAITDEEREKPYYQDLLHHVYSNNSDQWGSFEGAASCADRSEDLAGMQVESRYEIDLLSQAEVKVRDGEALDKEAHAEVQQPILKIAERLGGLGQDREKTRAILDEELTKALVEMKAGGAFASFDLASLTKPEEKMFLIMCDALYGKGVLDAERVKELTIMFEFALFEDISAYIAGTRDRVSRASNQDYALLCELNAFYADRIKEVNRQVAQVALANPRIAALMPEYFGALSRETATTQKQDWMNRFRVDRLGASDSFIKQVTKVLEKKRGRKYTPEKVREVITRYEAMTHGLGEERSLSGNVYTQAFYGQLRSQRERTIEALRVIAGAEVNPASVHLGEINLREVIETEMRIREGRYEEDQFASYTVQRMIDIFEDQRNKIAGELDKFESKSGKKREVLYGYMTKSKESACARMVGGVCVAADNPNRSVATSGKKENIWDMPNYLQLVFQEPETLQCQGLVLLHHFEEDGKKVLAASLNPSSTYLYSVDEAALFDGMMGALEKFAQANGFDMILISKNKTIRTNRTAGTFEKTMDARIGKSKKEFKFAEPKQFSFNPGYQIQEMDVIWEAKARV